MTGVNEFDDLHHHHIRNHDHGGDIDIDIDVPFKMENSDEEWLLDDAKDNDNDDENDNDEDSQNNSNSNAAHKQTIGNNTSTNTNNLRHSSHEYLTPSTPPTTTTTRKKTGDRNSSMHHSQISSPPADERSFYRGMKIESNLEAGSGSGFIHRQNTEYMDLQNNTTHNHNHNNYNNNEYESAPPTQSFFSSSSSATRISEEQQQQQQQQQQQLEAEKRIRKIYERIGKKLVTSGKIFCSQCYDIFDHSMQLTSHLAIGCILYPESENENELDLASGAEADVDFDGETAPDLHLHPDADENIQIELDLEDEDEKLDPADTLDSCLLHNSIPTPQEFKGNLSPKSSASTSADEHVICLGESSSSPSTSKSIYKSKSKSKLKTKAKSIEKTKSKSKPRGKYKTKPKSESSKSKSSTKSASTVAADKKKKIYKSKLKVKSKSKSKSKSSSSSSSRAKRERDRKRKRLKRAAEKSARLYMSSSSGSGSKSKVQFENFFKCPFSRCDVLSLTLNAFESHVVKSHLPRTKRPYSCSLCPSSNPHRYYTRGDWHTHVRIAHCHSSKTPQLTLDSIKKKPTVQRTTAATREVREQRQKEQEEKESLNRKPMSLFKCGYPDCGQLFGSRSVFNSHMTRHENPIVPYSCAYLGCPEAEAENKNKRNWGSLKELHRHMRLHLHPGERKCRFPRKLPVVVKNPKAPRYPCSVPGCIRKIQSLRNYLFHILNHTEKSFTCSICNMKFYSKYLMEKHEGLHEQLEHSQGEFYSEQIDDE